ncbi:ComF family protein [Larsenimonas rhizosphaerae]|uniref:Phosphoribosyltransferase family protein n=1 Tax=Larsenimonas rhizosphaerae TaxID=2944682 RepID=A0AA42CTW1_9GAMM|nr:phosphoribosyltransferase family protein [Larsenimonas rhizosphaerae]MCX2523476.1 phosphoribosyltransferase family protein [Larsenimonas rhizosphaerae]
MKQPLPMDHVFSPFLYDEDIAWLIVRFKHHADFRAGHNLFRLLEGHLYKVSDADSPALLPVPSHVSRCRERGFDPVCWLAQRVARRLAWPLLEAHKRRATPRQQQLTRAGRVKNQRQVFEVPDMTGKTVWLFDDVMTTGATLGSLAQACRARGACRVNALTLARTPASHESASMAAPPRRTP